MRVEPHGNLTITLIRDHVYGVKRLRGTGAPVVCRCSEPAVRTRCVERVARREVQGERAERYEPLPWPEGGQWPAREAWPMGAVWWTADVLPEARKITAIPSMPPLVPIYRLGAIIDVLA